MRRQLAIRVAHKKATKKTAMVPPKASLVVSRAANQVARRVSNKSMASREDNRTFQEHMDKDNQISTRARTSSHRTTITRDIAGCTVGWVIVGILKSGLNRWIEIKILRSK